MEPQYKNGTFLKCPMHNVLSSEIMGTVHNLTVYSITWPAVYPTPPHLHVVCEIADQNMAKL